jgi:hypothetical protein
MFGEIPQVSREKSMNKIAAILFALAALAAPLPAGAQTWPVKPIRLIVPFPSRSQFTSGDFRSSRNLLWRNRVECVECRLRHGRECEARFTRSRNPEAFDSQLKGLWACSSIPC